MIDFVLCIYISASEAKVRQCKLCDAKFEHKSELKAHYRTIHPNEPGNPVMSQPVSTTNLQTLAELDQSGGDIEPSAPLVTHDTSLTESTAGAADSSRIGETVVTDLVDMKVINGNNLFNVVSKLLLSEVLVCFVFVLGCAGWIIQYGNLSFTHLQNSWYEISCNGFCCFHSIPSLDCFFTVSMGLIAMNFLQ